MSSSGFDARPSPGDLAPVRVGSSHGSQSDRRVEDALTHLRSEVDRFAGRESDGTRSIRGAGTETTPSGEDAADVVVAGRSLHDALQQRLDEAEE